jgi:PAS domain S-box-containing protein
VRPIGDKVATIEQALETRRLTAALRESERRYRLVTEHIADAVFLLDRWGCVELANSRALELAGLRDEELRGRPFHAILTAEGGRCAQAQLAASVNGDGLAPFFEAHLVNKDGREVPVEINIAAVVEDGHVVGRVAVARDLTGRKELEDHLRQALKLEAIGRLAGGVAHDFNNLLTVISGHTWILHAGLRPDDALRQSVDSIGTAVELAAALIGHLLTFSHKQIHEPKILDLNAIIARLEPLLRRLIREDIELITVLDRGLGLVKADPGQLEQVILNLAANARDAMPQGGGLALETADAGLTVPDALRRSGGRGPYVTLTVTDTGIGMDADQKSHLFEAFFTTKVAGKGTGLGLATVYEIITQNGGHLEVESEPGWGTRIRIYLPRVADGAQADRAAPAPTAPLHGSETVLLVEDEKLLLDVARMILQMHGYTVLGATTPGEALLISDQHRGPIELLVTDVVMPQMNGAELAKRIASVRAGLKVLYMSGHTSAAIEHSRILERGAPLLQKPFTKVDLARKVREMLDGESGGSSQR